MFSRSCNSAYRQMSECLRESVAIPFASIDYPIQCVGRNCKQFFDDDWKWHGKYERAFADVKVADNENKNLGLYNQLSKRSGVSEKLIKHILKNKEFDRKLCTGADLLEMCNGRPWQHVERQNKVPLIKGCPNDMLQVIADWQNSDDAESLNVLELYKNIPKCEIERDARIPRATNHMLQFADNYVKTDDPDQLQYRHAYKYVPKYERCNKNIREMPAVKLLKGQPSDVLLQTTENHEKTDDYNRLQFLKLYKFNAKPKQEKYFSPEWITEYSKLYMTLRDDRPKKLYEQNLDLQRNYADSVVGSAADTPYSNPDTASYDSTWDNFDYGHTVMKRYPSRFFEDHLRIRARMFDRLRWQEELKSKKKLDMVLEPRPGYSIAQRSCQSVKAPTTHANGYGLVYPHEERNWHRLLCGANVVASPTKKSVIMTRKSSASTKSSKTTRRSATSTASRPSQCIKMNTPKSKSPAVQTNRNSGTSSQRH